MSTVGAGVRSHAAAILVVAAVAVVLVVLALLTAAPQTGITVLTAGLFVGVLLVPIGVVAGVVLNVVLVARRIRAVRSVVAPLTRSAARAASGTTTLQAVDRTLTVLLIAAGVVVGALWCVSDAVESRPGWVSNNTTPAGEAMGAVDGILLVLALGLLASIPAVLAVTVLQLGNRALIAGEAYALATRTESSRRIRIRQALSMGTSTAYAVLAVVGGVLIVPSFLS